MNTKDNTVVKKIVVYIVLIALTAADVSGVISFKKKGKKMPAEKTKQKYVNRLSKETSPYLLQHADNPVDWYPWSPQAFEKATRENKPIFLSIGYSSCHWCHVMEHESFENEDIAQIMNKHFVCIKVDREQRPDIDDIYMKAVQMMTGSGGWPLSVFLTPDGKPFYGGTYYPPQDSYGRPGFSNILLTIAKAWKEQKGDLVNSADRLTDMLTESTASAQTDISANLLDNTFSYLKRIFDPANGGFGTAPKFPQPQNIIMLLRYYRRTGNAEALQMATATLDKMADGGIHDHLGGGFHRYATDAIWLVPHFEKMLYDQALISKVYIDGYMANGNKRYAETATDIFDYVLRDMTDSAGGFYSAQDADSEGKEGTFYIWTKKQIEDALGKNDAKIFNAYFGVTKHGNFEENTNILYITGKTESSDTISNAKNKLFLMRSQRIHPFRDEKIITAWNGLMISSMAVGGAALNKPVYVDAAKRAADFVLTNIRTNGRLNRYYAKGKAVDLAVLDDYAFMTMALIDLYQASLETKWLEEAISLNRQMVKLFGDQASGGFYLTGADGEKLIAKTKPDYDGAIPSGNSVAAMAMLKLGAMTMNNELTAEGEKTLKAFSQSLNRPGALIAMTNAADFYLGPRQEIIIAGDKNNSDTKKMIAILHEKFLPNAVILLNEPSDKRIKKLIPFMKNQNMIDNKATAYVCENYICNQPTTDIKVLEDLLKRSTTAKEPANAGNNSVNK